MSVLKANCPSCAGPIEFKAGSTIVLVCPFCRSAIARTDRALEDLGKVSEIVELIRHSGADVVLVAMGNPKQELFIHNHLAATGCLVGIGVGALFDFLAGSVPRAVPRVQRWRLEWVYRLAQEPRRLAGRYLVGNPLFLMRILRQWWSGSRVTDAGPDLGGGDRAILPGHNTAIERDIAAQKAMSA